MRIILTLILLFSLSMASGFKITEQSLNATH